MTQQQEIRVLDEDFPEEVAFWEANQEELNRQYPAKYLVIRGSEVCSFLDTLEEVVAAEDTEFVLNPALIRMTDGVLGPDMPFIPFNYIPEDPIA